MHWFWWLLISIGYIVVGAVVTFVWATLSETDDIGYIAAFYLFWPFWLAGLIVISPFWFIAKLISG